MLGFALPLGRMACSEGMAGFGLAIFPSLAGRYDTEAQENGSVFDLHQVTHCLDKAHWQHRSTR
jgi:hypothetical protein